MKKITILILGLLLNQTVANAFAQGITLTLKEVSIETIFKEIEKQSKYRIIYDAQVVENTGNRSISVSNATIEHVLDLCLKNSPLEYAIHSTYVIIRQREKKNGNVAFGEPSLPIELIGKVTNEKGEPVVGATVTVKGSKISTATGADGYFSIPGVDDRAILEITSIGYQPRTIRLTGKDKITVQLIVTPQMMKEVVVMNTGYQQLPKERATGSFEHINNEELNRTTGPDILSRLEGVSAGVLIDRRGIAANQNTINVDNVFIRGLSTISAIKRPLIILNNFPYEGDINNINPNDVESITILKDAAAASIWGARAGNGVVVITTKKAQFNQPTRLAINASVNFLEKPNLFNNPAMSASEFIDVEEFLYEKGFYDGDINSTSFPALTPVVEILAKEKAGLLSSSEATELINALRKQDVRRDFDKYIYRASVNQQYSLSFTGGGERYKYALSGGFDKNPSSLVGDHSQRVTLRFDNSFTPLANLDVNIGIGYTNGNSQNNSIGNIGSSAYDFVNFPFNRHLYPYAQFADGIGRPLALSHNYRTDYLDTAGRGRLLDWSYRPLDEIRNADNKSKLQDIIFNGNIQYKLVKWLSIQFSYQYENMNDNSQQYYSNKTYYTRNLINLFSQFENNTVKYIVPNNGILSESTNKLTSQSGRLQLNINRSWNSNHILNAIIGGEVREKNSFSTSNTTYGFNKELWSSAIVDHLTFYPLYGGLRDGYGRVPGGAPTFSKLMDRFVSMYGNAAYTYQNRYTLSASLRKDAANIFGVDVNNKWKPFWSLGASWDISNEPFYDLKALSYFKLRMTYGYQGNVNNSISPYTILYKYSAVGSIINQPSALIRQPGDPSLSWENIRQVNLGLDFGSFENIITGTIEYYQKKSSKLIFGVSIDPTTGIDNVYRNSATMIGKGVDISINSRNLDGGLKWRTSLLFSYSASKVTNYSRDDKGISVQGIISSGGQSILPIKGYAPYGVYSYAFAGLDPNNGNPQGYLGKDKSTDYRAIIRQTIGDTPTLVYHGTGLAPYFGNLSNTFNFKNFSFLINISYRFGYYFRKNTISYFSLFTSGEMHPDYSKRWQIPGDENRTHVPSMIYPISDADRDIFYGGSSVNVLKGDHIRLQNIRIGYSIDNKYSRLPFQNVELYLIANNLGLIWRANKEKLDPDYDTGNALFPPLKRLAVGLKLNL